MNTQATSKIRLESTQKPTEYIPSTGEFKFRPKTASIAGYMKMVREQRGLEPLPLESDLLIKRIQQGGKSGHFLAAAFISAYRNQPFVESLYDLINLDAEGFRLFHEVLHMRHVPGWSDDALYQVEQQINAVLRG